MLQASDMRKEHRFPEARSTDPSKAMLEPNGCLTTIFPMGIHSTDAREGDERGKGGLKVVYKEG